jgi:glycosyltransferase involved in cell wall biosynthesis
VISKLKLLILVNWKERGDFLRLRRIEVRKADVLQPLFFEHPAASRWNNLSRYLSEFYVPVRAMFLRNRYDVVISWQMRIGVCYGILKRIVHSRKSPLHIIQDFHIDLTQTRRFYGFNLALLKLAVPGIDYFFCTSTEEEDIYSRMFDIPRDRIYFLPLVEAASSFEEPHRPIKDHIFSYGKSDRDFDTLVRSAAATNMETYILSQKYRPTVPVPENVHIMRDFMSGREMIEWISSSRIVVLPLMDYRISAGQISMLEVMALARPLIITRNMATKEYAVHGQSALFFEAGNDRELSKHIQYLWENREKAEEIGRQAREAASKCRDRHITIFYLLLERCAMDIQKGEHQ